jgi:hypothetical protein
MDSVEETAARDLIDGAKQSGPSTVVRRSKPGRALELPSPTRRRYLSEDFPYDAAAFHAYKTTKEPNASDPWLSLFPIPSSFRAASIKVFPT